MVSLLAFACCAAHAQEGAPTSPIDREITIVGRDETMLPIPRPDAAIIPLPQPDLTPPDPVWVPAVEPPVGELVGPWTFPAAQAVLRETGR